MIAFKAVGVFIITISLVSSTDITNIVFGKNGNAVPVAFGDFNSDELTDLFVIRGKSVEILLNRNNGEPLLQTNNLLCNFTCPITSVVPGDFNGDAFMDVLVSAKCKESELYYNISILWGNLTSLHCNEIVLLRTQGEPLALDYNDDFITDLFGEDDDGKRMFWVFSINGTVKKIPFEHKSADSSPRPSPIKKPHANAYLDLNNDYIADLFITSGKYEESSFFEVWLGSPEGIKFPSEHILLPPKVDIVKMGQSVFLDVELEGKLDHILPIWTGKESKLYAYSNKTDSWHDLIIDLQDPSGVTWKWSWTPGIPLLQGITVRGGDFNMDGYPDLLAPLISSTGAYQTVLLENSPCTTCENFTRNFQVKWNAFYPHGNDTVAGAFFDIFQDGIMDIILVYKHGDVFSMGAFKNNLDYDTNFLKVMVLSGLQNEQVPFVITPLGKKKRTFGSNLPGPRIWYKTLDQEGNLRAGVSAQIPQSAHFALSLPYTTFALGRTPNFVETVGVGFAHHERVWPQLIPNSQMVVIPNPIDNPAKWKVQLFVTPSKIVFLSGAALVATCLVILLVIGFLHWKERKTDRLDRLKEGRFNFDAM